MGTPWPHDTLEKLREAGYEYVERGKCLAPACNVEIFWFVTPNKKWMPMERFSAPLPAGPGDAPAPPILFRPHFSSCPDARKFSRRGTPGETHVEERE